MKILSGDAARTVREQWRSRKVLEAPVYDGGNFKEVLSAARDEHYARFA